MVTITIKVQGLQENINSLNKSSNAIRTELRKALDIVGDKGVKQFQNEAHVITGKMKRGIHKGKVTNTTLDIDSQVDYAEFENRRGGAHAFIDKGAKQIEPIAQAELNNAIQRVMK